MKANQKQLKKIRKEMIEDGYSEYNAYGRVDKESKEIWENEFKKRLNQK